MSSSSRTRSQSRRAKTPAGLPAPKKLLQLDWHAKTLAIGDKDEQQLIKNPKTALLRLLPNAQTNWTDQERITIAQFFAEFQAQLKAYIDESFTESNATVQMIADHQSVVNQITADALQHLNHNTQVMQQVIQELLVEREANKVAATELLDIEMPDAPELPDYTYYLQEAIAKGWLKITAPAPAPEVEGRRRAASLFTQAQFPLPIGPSPPLEPESPIVPFELTPRIEPPASGTSYTPLPPDRRSYGGLAGGLFGTAREFFHGGYSPPRGNRQPVSILGGGMPPPPPPKVRPPPENRPPPGPQEEEAGGPAGGAEGGIEGEDRPAGGAAGGGDQGGGAGGGKGGRVARGGGGDQGGSDGDSEPEGDDPRDWKRFYRRQMRRQEKRMLETMATLLQGGTPQTTAGRAREPKAPQPSKFKGEAHDVDRFLRQCENVFEIESSSFQRDTTKIRYTGNLLEGQAPINWYEAYHNLIDQGSANRAAGCHVNLDAHWAHWESFTHAFRSSFGDRVTREEAVVKWDKLSQTAGIDTFLDQVVQLMWKTGYKGEVVDDKISQGLSSELALDWAKVAAKPASLHERIQLIRQMGHVLERHKKLRTPGTGAEKKGGEKKRAKRKGQSATADTEKQTTGENKTPPGEKKDKAVELKGMSEYYLSF